MDYMKERILALATYISETNSTVRQAAKVFGISKSTVHKDMTERLEFVHPYLFEEVHRVLQQNKAERHIRGGEATKHKYERLSLLEKGQDL